MMSGEWEVEWKEELLVCYMNNTVQMEEVAYYLCNDK